MDYLSKSYRLDTEVIEWLEGLKGDYGSVNKGLRAAIILCNNGEGGDSTRPVLTAPLPVEIPSVQVGAANVQQGFKCRCVHTGCRGALFQGRTRFEKMCPACSESGHTGEPRNCAECFNDQGPT